MVDCTFTVDYPCRQCLQPPSSPASLILDHSQKILVVPFLSAFITNILVDMSLDPSIMAESVVCLHIGLLHMLWMTNLVA